MSRLHDGPSRLHYLGLATLLAIFFLTSSARAQFLSSDLELFQFALEDVTSLSPDELSVILRLEAAVNCEAGAGIQSHCSSAQVCTTTLSTLREIAEKWTEESATALHTLMFADAESCRCVRIIANVMVRDLGNRLRHRFEPPPRC